MRHEIQPEELMAYLDGELLADRAAATAEHLSRCRECQAVAADIQSVSRRLTEWQIEDVGPEVGRVLEQQPVVARARARRPVWRRVLPWAAAFATVLTVLILNTARYRASSRPKYESFITVQAPDPPDFESTNAKSPMLIRSSQISLITSDFAKTRSSLEETLARHQGFVGKMTVTAPPEGGRTLHATLRVPSPKLDTVMAETRKLGRVESESQNGEDIAAQYTDLEARLSNARVTEQRLNEILRQRTGKISDVLEVEKQISRMRGEIERMEAERKNLSERVAYATLEVSIVEEYHARLGSGPLSTAGRLRNAAIEGYGNLAESLTGLAVFLLAYGPSVVLWGGLLLLPAVFIWRWKRGRR